MWHVSSRSSVATLRTAIHLLLTYLLTYSDRERYTMSVSAYLNNCKVSELHTTFCACCLWLLLGPLTTTLEDIVQPRFCG